ncbi:restriction endonuclease [Actinophytocola xanthii]|uniref:restriction endonuclease n=1 Tax=Actinophytocola xanthii TaxID=1912961 RepID=UPI00130195EC|nr:restriction endonuclease [Actinophytocola xanthii]
MADGELRPSASGDGGAEHPSGDLLPGKDPELLPTPSLSWERFEDFTERLLSAHRFCAEPLRHVVRVERWGRRGDNQDGIDFEGSLCDGASASWQCKRQDTLTPRQVRAAVKACTFQAEVHYLVFSGEASRNARNEMAKHPKWELLDRRGLSRLLNDLPLHKQRDVLDATWGAAFRKRFLEVPGEDAFLSLETFVADRRDPGTMLNDLGPHVGREAELQALSTALHRHGDWPAVVVVTGPGGRGKTRLLVEALIQFQEENRQVPVLCLSPGRGVDAAALAELPHTPAVVVIDDAHQEPAAIAPLLQYAREVDGTQLVLSSRPSGTDALRRRIINARYPLSRIATVEVGELKKSQARELVDSLTEDLGLAVAAREYFAGQAVHSPHVAVIAVGLIRRGELTTPVVVDIGLREQVLARYEELAAGEIDGVAAPTVRRLLAVYAALGPIDDEDLRPAFADFCGLTRTALLRLRQGLHDRGVLVTSSGLTRVVPDVLADDILEKEAAVGSDATNFAEELWNVFGGAHSQRLVIALGELDWRLARQGGPRVFDAVWEMVRSELRRADHAGLDSALGRLDGLAVTQPHALVAALEDIRARLDDTESTITPDPDADGDGDGSEDAPPSVADEYLQWWGRPANAETVRQRMPPLYGQCARSSPELLETVLDALWALRRSDVRPTHQYPGHAERVIVDRLANLEDLIDASFPERIVDRVRRWLAEPPDDADVTTPLFVLRPLLAKECERHQYVESSRQLTFTPLLVSASWARPIRDGIRALLLEQASGADVRRAATAVDLLGEALRPPMGRFGQEVGDEEVLAWEADDLATLDALKRAAEATRSPVVRRMIRRAIAWIAMGAPSLPVRHAALTLLTALDELEDDDVVELLLHPQNHGELLRRGVPVPTLDELRATEAARVEREPGVSDDQRAATLSARTSDRLERRKEAHDVLVEQVVRELVDHGDPSDVAAALDKICREIRRAIPDKPLSLWDVWRHLSTVRPDLVPGIVLAIAAGEPGPLDENLDQLLHAWVEVDETRAIAWLESLERQRAGVRSAVGNAFANYGWTDRGDTFVDLHRRGTQDPDPDVQNRFLAGSAQLLANNPPGTVADLLAANIAPSTASRVLELACRYDGASWGAQLHEADARAVLNLVEHAGWTDYTVQQLVSGIAKVHPRLVLDQLVPHQGRLTR